MAHALLKEFKSNLAGIIAQALGRLESYAIVYATRKINEIIDELRDKCPPPPVLNRLSKLVGKKIWGAWGTSPSNIFTTRISSFSFILSFSFLLSFK